MTFTPHEWQSIALLLWRTPANASKPYIRATTTENPYVLLERDWLGDVALWWRDIRVNRWLIPRWARSSALVGRVLQMPWDQRVAVAQLVFGRVLGSVTNPRALFYAFVQCAPLLDPAIPTQVLQPRVGAFACLHVRIQLANGDRQSARAHLRNCDACRRADIALQRVRQALLIAVGSAVYPAPLYKPSWMHGMMHHIAWMVAMAALWVAPVMLNQNAVPVVMRPQSPRALVQSAQQQLFSPVSLQTDQSQYWQVEIFWRFANDSVAWLNAEAWYQYAPNQYRTQLVHQSGGNPYELDIVTPYQRLYHVTSLYAPHRLLSDDMPATVLMPNDDEIVDVWQWRMRQGAWGMAPQILNEVVLHQQMEVIGVTVGAYGEPALRIAGHTPSGTVWLDVASHSGELMAIWQIDNQNQPQLRWRLRQHVLVENNERMRYVVVQPLVGVYEKRHTSALHPAVPLIPFDVGERTGDQLSLWRFGRWQTYDLNEEWQTLDAQ